MKSTSKNYYIGLDHIRAIAAYLVFCWHFLHSTNGLPVPLDHIELMPPVSWLNQGHLGVSIFMVLSGYLFAKILDDKKVNYTYFYVNRFLRVAPLMIFVVFINSVLRYMDGQPSLWYFFSSLMNGLVYPSLPNAGWSITAEFHFYLLLPFLLWVSRHSNHRLLILIALAVSFRTFLYWKESSIQHLAYWTIIGRIDLFIIGMLGFRYGKFLDSSKTIAIFSLINLSVLYAILNSLGGYHSTQQSFFWIFFAAIEGVCIVPLICYYDRISVGFNGFISKQIANIGKYSYSIYLLHSFVVFKAASYLHLHIIDLSNIYLAILFSTVSFLLFVPITYLSYNLIEKPFLNLRITYLK